MNQLDTSVNKPHQCNAQVDHVGDRVVETIYQQAETIASRAVTRSASSKTDWTRVLDNVLTSKLLGYPIMLLLLGAVFWITVEGANVPSGMIAGFLFGMKEHISAAFLSSGAPAWLHGILVLGMYKTLAWVVAVMLPPMAIFFPLFTLLEDLGYLPRIAFNLDNAFKRAKACGKQALTMCMGFGCNAAGIVSCRIIDSPRERLIATLTNNFVPCNGRFPTLIAIATIFMGGAVASTYETAVAAAAVTGLVLLGITVTLITSWVLSNTLLKGEPSSMTLELPPYRKPQFGAILYRSIIDRTIFVLIRAVTVAAPAGAITWLLGNIYIGDLSIISYCANFLAPIGYAIGLDGFILMAFILGLPANEIVVPILIMAYMSSGYMLEFESLEELRDLFIANGWTWLTAVNTMLFSLLHWPCATTLISIKKETGSNKWTWIAFLLPTVIAFIVCFIVAQAAYFFGLV
jgi:ferrous iron transport protein B